MLALVLVGVALDLFEDLAVGVWGGDLALDFGGVELRARLRAGRAALRAGLGVDVVDLLALLEEDAVHAHVDLIVTTS